MVFKTDIVRIHCTKQSKKENMPIHNAKMLKEEKKKIITYNKAIRVRTVWCVCLFRMLNSNALHRIAHQCSNIEKTFLHRILKFSTSNIDHKNQRYNKIGNMWQYFLSSVVNEIHKYYKYFIFENEEKVSAFFFERHH